MEQLFGYDTTLVNYIDYIFADSSPHSQVLKYFYHQLYREFAPDINGYTLVFFVPPDLSGYRVNVETESGSFDGERVYAQTKESYMGIVSKIMTFAAIDFTPPQSQVRVETISTRSGSIPIASEVSETDTMSITFLDNRQLDIYMFHHIWVEYIREVLEGTIEPDPSYYDPEYLDEFGEDDNYGAIDYAASCYIVKYKPDMKSITYAAKCVGIFPQSLPNKELIGSRTTNEVVTLPFTYSCSGFREALYTEQEAGLWIFDELNDELQKFVSQSETPLFGGFLGGIISNVIGPTSGALKNLTGNAAKLGGIAGNLQNAGSKALGTVKAISGGDYSSIFSVNKPKL